MRYRIRKAQPNEYAAIGQLMVAVFAQLPGFPSPEEQPAYYQLLANIGQLANQPDTSLLLACNEQKAIGGAVVYIGNMQHYGSGGIAPQEKQAAGFRLLAVSPDHRGHGLGRQLVEECISRGREHNKEQLIIHSTKAMQTAWAMYERMGFVRAPELDFMQNDFPVCGFRYFF